MYETEIIYVDKNYNLQKINWKNDSLIIKDKPVNKSGIKITVKHIGFRQRNEDKNQFSSFTELDLNKDNKINNSELEKISSLIIEYLLTNKNIKFQSQLNLNIFK